MPRVCILVPVESTVLRISEIYSFVHLSRLMLGSRFLNVDLHPSMLSKLESTHFCVLPHGHTGDSFYRLQFLAFHAIRVFILAVASAPLEM